MAGNASVSCTGAAGYFSTLSKDSDGWLPCQMDLHALPMLTAPIGPDARQKVCSRDLMSPPAAPQNVIHGPTV